MVDLPSQREFGDYGQWPGRDVLDPDGEPLGRVHEIYLDRATGIPEWVLVDMEGAGARFVPLADARVEERVIHVAHRREQVATAPDIGHDLRIDQDEERRLYAHYEVPYSEAESSTGLPVTNGDREEDAGVTSGALEASPPPAGAALGAPEPAAAAGAVEQVRPDRVGPGQADAPPVPEPAA